MEYLGRNDRYMFMNANKKLLKRSDILLSFNSLFICIFHYRFIDVSHVSFFVSLL